MLDSCAQRSLAAVLVVRGRRRGHLRDRPWLGLYTVYCT